jgi:pyruvate kinase
MVAINRSDQDPCNTILKPIVAEVTRLRQQVEINASQHLPKNPGGHPSGAIINSSFIPGPYPAMRHFDPHHLKACWFRVNSSPLGRAETSVLSAIDFLMAILRRTTDNPYPPDAKKPVTMPLIPVGHWNSSILLNYLAPFMNKAKRLVW